MFFKGCRSDSSGDSAPCQLFTLPISEKKATCGARRGASPDASLVVFQRYEIFYNSSRIFIPGRKKVKSDRGGGGTCGGAGRHRRQRGAGDAGRLRVAGVRRRGKAQEAGGAGVWEQGGRQVQTWRKRQKDASSIVSEPLPYRFSRETASDTVNRCPAGSAGRTPQTQRNRPGLFSRGIASGSVNRCPAVSAGRTPQRQRNRVFPTVSPGGVAEWGSYSRSGPR